VIGGGTNCVESCNSLSLAGNMKGLSISSLIFLGLKSSLDLEERFRDFLGTGEDELGRNVSPKKRLWVLGWMYIL